MKNILFILTFFFNLLYFCPPVFAQFGNYQFADSTHILLVFDNEQDTSAINSLKNEWNATEIGSTALTRIHLWQIPADTVLAYGGPIGIQNHAYGKAVIKSGDLNFLVNIIQDFEGDDDGGGGGSQVPCADSIFECTPGNHAVKVAFLDTGLDGEVTGGLDIWQHNHPRFLDRLWQNPGEANQPLNIDNDNNGFLDDVKGWDFTQNNNLPLDENNHGSHVAGIAAEKFEFNADDQAKIMVLQTQDSLGVGSMWNLVQALDYALRQNVKIINLSLAYLAPVPTGTKPTALEYLMDFARLHRGTLFVAAAGNDSLNLDEPHFLADSTPVRICPASFSSPNLLVAAAADCENVLAPFSNFGQNNVDIAAPGVHIFSTILGGNYEYFSGTSQATAQVAAAAALVGTKNQYFDWKKIRTEMLAKSTAVPGLAGLTASGRMLTFCQNYPAGGDALTVSVAAPQVFCLGGSGISMTAHPAGGTPPYTFSWSGGGSSAQKLATAPGIFTVTATDNLGETATETVQVFGSSAPFADVPRDTVFCNETSATLEILNAVGGANYAWSNNLNGPIITVNPTQSTTYIVTTTLPTGCTSTTAVPVVVKKMVASSMPSQSICKGECVTLAPQIAGATTPFQYIWSTGETTPTVVKCPISKKTYRVTVTSTEGCTATRAAVISIKPAPVIANFPTQTICPCGSATLTANVTSGSAPFSFLWSPGGQSTPAITVSPAATTSFSVIVTDNFGCTSSKSATVTVKCLPPTGLSATTNSSNQTATFSWDAVCSPPTALQLRWRCGTSGAWTTINLTNLAATSHTISLPPNCTGLNFQIRNKCCNNLWSAWAASPILKPLAGDREGENLSEIFPEIFPNPVGEVLFLKFLNVEKTTDGSILNSHGQFFKNFNLDKKFQHEIFVGDLPAGIYFLQLQNDTSFRVLKFVKN